MEHSQAQTEGSSAFVMCYLFGFLLEPRLTLSVPFFGVKEESDHFPVSVFSSLHFSQLNQSPAAQASQAGSGFLPRVTARIPKLQAGPEGQLVLVAGSISDGETAPVLVLNHFLSDRAESPEGSTGWSQGHALGLLPFLPLSQQDPVSPSPGWGRFCPASGGPSLA